MTETKRQVRCPAWRSWRSSVQPLAAGSLERGGIALRLLLAVHVCSGRSCRLAAKLLGCRFLH